MSSEYKFIVNICNTYSADRDNLKDSPDSPFFFFFFFRTAALDQEKETYRINTALVSTNR